MKTLKFFLTTLSALAFSLLIVSCSEPAASSNASETTSHSVASTTKQPLIKLEVYKNPSCGCCSEWVKHMNKSGFETNVHESNNLSQLKLDKGIKPNYQSCHTAISSNGYVFEGHVPAKFVKQFLKASPKDAIGLTVPGMVAGSPGMEMGDKFTPYKVWLIKKDGSLVQYAKLDSSEEQF